MRPICSISPMRNRIFPRSAFACLQAKRFPRNPPPLARRNRSLDSGRIGSTEALHIFISNTPEDIRPGSSGRVVSGYSARIFDEHGADVADGESGQLYISGDSTARCYWNNVERTAMTMIDGWLNTGDTYRRDAQGYFYYCGRSDDMLKVGGIWCSPFEIELKLVEHPDVVEAAVVGRVDQEDLIKPEAFVVLKRAGWKRRTLRQS